MFRVTPSGVIHEYRVTPLGVIHVGRMTRLDLMIQHDERDGLSRLKA